MKPVLFISYSHKNEEFKNQLVQQLEVLEPEGLIEIWLDDRIPAGAEWLEEINGALLQADIVVLLITSEFLTSEFILEKEVPTFLKRRRAGGLSLYPIIGLPCAWQEVSWLAELNVRPKNGDPVWGKDRRTAERYLAEIAREIAENVRKTESTKLPIRTAIGSLESRFQEAFSPPKSIDFNHIVNTINETISFGAPIYDSGDIEGCVETYHHTARRLLTQLRMADPEINGSGMLMMNKDTGGMSTRPEMSDKAGLMGGFGTAEPGEMETGGPGELITSILINATRYDLRRTLETIEQLRGRDPGRAAWDLRFCFDRILLLLQGFEKTVSLTTSSIRYSSAELKSNFREAISLAGRTGRMIYIRGTVRSLPDERSIVACGAFFLATSRLLLKYMATQLKVVFEPPAEKFLYSTLDQEKFLYSMLDRIVTEHREVTQSNAYLISWTAL